MSDVVCCDRLVENDLVARVASSMDAAGMAHPPFALVPGRCRYCGHSLGYAYAMTREVNGQVQRAQYAADSPEAARMQDLQGIRGFRLGSGVALVQGRHENAQTFPTILLTTNGACEALTEEVFRRASAIVRERSRRAALTQAVQGQARELATRSAARAAARALAGSLVQDTPSDGF